MMRTRNRILWLVAFVVCVFVATSIILSLSASVGNTFTNIQANFSGGAEQRAQGGLQPMATAPAAMLANASPADGDVARGNTAQSQGENTDGPAQQRVILRNATLNITVDDVSARITEIGTMASEMGGWVVTSNTSQSTASNGEKLTYGNITVRVPAERLDDALGRIKTGVNGVNSETVTGQDVTQQYVDLSSRLKNLEAAETQLQVLIERADNVPDVMSVFSQLVATRGEIESIRGQLTYFEQAAAFSSIQVTLVPPTPGAVVAQTTGWNPLRTLELALGALIGLVQGVVDLAIFVVVVLLPPLIVIGLPAWLIFRRVRRRATPVAITETSAS
jgi:hypothetical protein